MQSEVQWHEDGRIRGGIRHATGAEGTRPVRRLVCFVKDDPKFSMSKSRERVVADHCWLATTPLPSTRVGDLSTQVLTAIEELTGQHRVKHVLDLEASVREEAEIKLGVVEDFRDIRVGEERSEGVLPAGNRIKIDNNRLLRSRQGHQA
jgi:hypothetical protein